MSTGGSIKGLSIKGRGFSVAADADTNRKVGGYENALEMNGDATARVVKTMSGWALTGLVIDVNDLRGDQEYLQEIADGKGVDINGFVWISIEYASGAIYSGRGQVLEAIEGASMNTTATLSLAGPGKLVKQ